MIEIFVDVFLRIKAMQNVEYDEEKDSAFLGVCNMIELDRFAIFDDLVYFCDAAVFWPNPSSDLKAKFDEVEVFCKTVLQ